MKNIEIKRLNNEELSDALRLHHECIFEEFDQYNITVKKDFEYELKKLVGWANEEVIDDIRIIYGAFDDNLLVGFAGASFAEPKDYKNAMEINYLFVNKEYRGRRIGLRLMDSLVKDFIKEKRKNVILYNWHIWKSNNFYAHLGGQLLKQTIQKISGEDLLVDIFYWKMSDLQVRLEEKLSR
jgi:GNAT superfamily N-acetyltransferase